MSGRMWAAVGWSAEAPQWTLYMVTPALELSPLGIEWPGTGGPPTLMQRYDALVTLGYAVVGGGPEAWEWTERLDSKGRPILFGYTEVRALRLDELPAAEDVQQG